MTLPKELSINKKIWNSFSEEETNSFVTRVFNHYKNNGFPYFPTDNDWRMKELNKTKKYDFKSLIEENFIKQSMHGLSLCWSFHPQHYEVNCNNLMSVKECFDNDDLLKKVILKRMRMGDNMSDNGLRKMLKIYSGVQCPSNFRPTAAAVLYNHFLPSGGIVWDMSSGYGGRILGAHLAGVKYIGTDPCTAQYEGNKQLVDWLQSDSILYQRGSEEGIQEKVDLCFTSPPYFDCEKYSDEETQSYRKYPTKEQWMNGFMKTTIEKCYEALPYGGILALNIQNVKSYPTIVEDTTKIAKKRFTQQSSMNLVLSGLGKKSFKTEPILIFKK